jgi:hypothetical protein
VTGVLKGLKLASPYIAGVEVTQAIQWYEADKHLTDPADRGPDNGVTLIANKPAWVRVYIGGFKPHAVRGEVKLQRRNKLEGYFDVFTPSQQGNPTVAFSPNTPYATQRRNLDNTLNFVIPASEMHGLFRLVVSITADAADSDTQFYQLDVTLVQTLQIRGIPIRYWGPDPAGNQVQLGPTTLADFVSTATWSMLTYPVENVPRVSLAGIFTWSETLAGPPDGDGGCSTGWYDLTFWLSVAKALDGNLPDVIYYGLLPAGTPDGPIVGCDSNGASVGKVQDGITMAHEMGHYQGFPHAPCGKVGTPDSGYPAYEPYDSEKMRSASIGEYGLNVSTGTIYDPAVAKDYMSYCSPPWTSLYHYRMQMLSRFFDPRYVDSGNAPPWWDQYRIYRPYDVRRDLPYPTPFDEYRVHEAAVHVLNPSIVVTGLLRDGQLDIRSVLRLDAAASEGTAGEERLELLDADGAVVGRARLRGSTLRASGGSGGCCGGCQSGEGECRECPRLVQAVVPYTGAVASMRIVRGADTLWSRAAPKRAAKIDRLDGRLAEEELHLSWHASGDVQETHLRRSSDGGKTWQLLELRVQTHATTIPCHALPPGKHEVQVLASDGFHTVHSESFAFEIPQRPPSAAIHWPLDTATVSGKSSLRLWGAGISASGQLLPDAEHHWTIDGKAAGSGRDIWIAPPASEGEHLVVLTVRDKHGEARVSSRIWVSDSGHSPRRLLRDY